MSQAYTAIDEWKAFSSAFEKFSEMVVSLYDPQTQQADHGQIERRLEAEGRELLRVLPAAWLDIRNLMEKRPT